MYDLIVSGAGPAGSTIARKCANQGYKVLLLDSAIFPREKLCGGGLTPFIYRHLDLDISHLILNKVKKLKFSYKDKIGDLYSMNSFWVDMINRKEFDNFLLKEAIKSGVSFKENEKTQNFIQNENSIDIITNKNKYKAKFLIGADGVYSKIAQKMGFNVNKNFFMLETQVLFKKNLSKEDKDIIIVDIGSVKQGCAWIFPKNDFASIGVCTSNAKFPDLKKDLDNFINIHKDLFLLENIKYKGIIVPYYRFTNKKIADKRVMLIGDAARLMNPMTGEGISVAIWSANIASEYVCDALKKNKDIKVDQYINNINNKIIRNLKISYFAFKFIKSFPLLFFKLFFKKGPKILTKFLDPYL